MSGSRETWIESVEEHKETLEKVAEMGNTPLSDDFERLLYEYAEETGNTVSIDRASSGSDGIQW